MNLELEGAHLEVGHIIQITKNDLDDPAVLYPLFGAILVITEIKNWGVKAEINYIRELIPFRIPHGDFIVVGKVFTKNTIKQEIQKFIGSKIDLLPEFKKVLDDNYNES